MVSDDQYETFWYDLKLPDLVEEIFHLEKK